MSNLTSIIKESFAQYSGAVLQSRALVDVRDCLKPSARQIFYCMLLKKLVHSKPYKKTANAVGMAMADFYIHGDSSCEGIIMRAGQSFAMRYPLVDVKGNMGSLIESGNWAAARYTESRLSKISDELFTDIDKNTISEWRDNYDNTKQYPSVLPSKGYYNIVNGTMGIGIGAASSIPQFNIKDVNEALIKLLWDEDIPDDELICMPDFATGGVLLNADEVKESLRKGQGKSCILRSVVEYDDKERCLIVKEIPYSVYTATICKQLEELLFQGGFGIDRFNDLTGAEPLIKIYLSKGANPATVLKKLYKETSLQYYYAINMTMLDNGRFPKVFTWKEALQAHLKHEKEVYKRGYEFDLEKIKARLHIVEGIIIALAHIEEIIQTIKGSSSTVAATIALTKNFNLTEIQAKAVLDIKLSRLARLEVEKFIKEKEELLTKEKAIIEILSNEELFNKEIEKGLRNIINIYGDDRRTQIMNLQTNEEDDTPIEEKIFIVNLTNNGNLYAYENTTLLTQKRGGRGSKIKLPKNEFITNSISDSNSNTLLLFSNKGKVYSTLLNNIPLETLTYPESIFNMDADEYICNICTFDKTDSNDYIIFTTKNGMVKKSKMSEYKVKRGGGIVAIKLKDNDSIVNVSFGKKETLGILTKFGNFVKINIEKINPIGRVTAGVQGIKLSDDDYVVCAQLIDENVKSLMSISTAGLAKITPIEEFPETSRAIKGSLMQKLKDTDFMSYFIGLKGSEKDTIIISSKGSIKVPISQLQVSGRTTIGTLAKKLDSNETIKSLLIN